MSSPAHPRPAGHRAGTRRVARRAAELTPQGLPGLRTVVHRTLGRMFGPPRFDPRGAPDDPGLVAPGSASWQVIGEPAAIAGGLRALLLQVAHPFAMAGVDDHSAFREDPIGRLQRTSAYVTTTTFGSTREVLQVSRIVRGVHRRVRGTTSDGRVYSADDPHLLAWVSIALTSSFLAADTRWSPLPVAGAQADAFVAEQSRIAALLDRRVDLDIFDHDEAARRALRAGDYELPMLTDGTLPSSVAELTDLLSSYAPELGVDDHSAFREDPIGRLQRTSAYVTTTTFGSTREVLQVSRIVRGVHRRVRGTTSDGRVYSADDPHLLAWVSIALTSSFLAADTRWSPLPVAGAQADAFVAWHQVS